MNNKLLKIGQNILTIWGGISLVGVISIMGYFAYSMTIGNTTVENRATKSDVRFVLNWCGLGDERIEKVVHSYTSSRSITGDHLDAYAIKITDVTVEELVMSNDAGSDKWYRADSLPKILDDALVFTSGWQFETPWFPTEATIRSQGFYIYSWSIYCHGVSPTGAQLIFLNPTEKMVYYVSASM